MLDQFLYLLLGAGQAVLALLILTELFLALLLRLDQIALQLVHLYLVLLMDFRPFLLERNKQVIFEPHQLLLVPRLQSLNFVLQLAILLLLELEFVLELRGHKDQALVLLLDICTEL